MTSCSQLFSSYSPCAGNKKIKTVDGSFSALAEIGPIKMSPILTLHNVLHVPNLSCNLLSISKLTLDHNCRVNFFSSHCEFQELASGRMIGNVRESRGLYFLEDGSKFSNLVQSSCFESTSISGSDEIMLWHYRLGHPSFQYLKHLFLNLFCNKSPSSFKCEIRVLTKQLRVSTKQLRVSYLPRPYKPTKPCSLILSDVGDPRGPIFLEDNGLSHLSMVILGPIGFIY